MIRKSLESYNGHKNSPSICIKKNTEFKITTKNNKFKKILKKGFKINYNKRNFKWTANR